MNDRTTRSMMHWPGKHIFTFNNWRVYYFHPSGRLFAKHEYNYRQNVVSTLGYDDWFKEDPMKSFNLAKKELAPEMLDILIEKHKNNS